MVLLIDANVVMDYLLVRRKYFYQAKQVLLRCQTPSVESYISFHSIPIIWYALRRYPVQERRRALMEVTDLLTVVSASHDDVIDAIKDEKFIDFEDCLQEKCALQVNADYIVTNNIKDFAASEIPAVTPAEMLEIIRDS